MQFFFGYDLRDYDILPKKELHRSLQKHTFGPHAQGLSILALEFSSISCWFLELPKTLNHRIYLKSQKGSCDGLGYIPQVRSVGIPGFRGRRTEPYCFREIQGTYHCNQQAGFRKNRKSKKTSSSTEGRLYATPRSCVPRSFKM